MTAVASHNKLTSPLEFGHMISSLLLGIVDAQAHAAHATLDYVRSVGLKRGTLEMVPFRIPGGSEPGSAAETEVLIPKLSLLGVPNLRIQEASVDFRAKVIGPAPPATPNPASEHAAPLRLQVSFAHQRRTAGRPVSGTAYTMRVNLKIVQEELPAGLEQFLLQADARRSSVAPSR